MAEVEELRVQPQDILAEQSVLGAIFIDESKLVFVREYKANTMVATHKYGEELSEAASNLESLNSLYKLQLERTERQVSAQAGIAENLDSLNRQMLSFKDNLKSLNTIYGGMLSAMSGAR